MADLLLFPQARRIGKARHVAATWLRRGTVRERDIYWRRIIGEEQRVLRRLGFAEGTVDRALYDLAAAVNHEIGVVEVGSPRRTDVTSDNPSGVA